MNVFFVVVHYNNSDELIAFLKMLNELPRPDGFHISVAIADNSGNLTHSWDFSGFPVRVHSPQKNLGYANGCQWAIDNEPDIARYADYVVIANTDVSLDERFFYLLDELVVSVRTGVLAPSITLPDGAPQNPHLRQRPGKLRLACLQCLFCTSWGLRLLELLSFLKSSLLRAWRKLFRPTCSSAASRDSIYAAHGSLFLLCSAFLNRGGRVGYDAFLYGEEIHVAEQARRLGLDVLFVPELQVEHRAHAVTRHSAARIRARRKYESMSFIRRTYFSRAT